MKFLKTFQHLLPLSRAWDTMVDKQLRRFFDGLGLTGNDVKDFTDDVLGDAFPATTRDLDIWENQWNLRRASVLTEQERRNRLDAAWKATGGQSPRYLQDSLQAAGFDVYVHEFWQLPRTTPPVVRNPFLYLRQSMNAPQAFELECGQPLAQCGNPNSGAGNPVGERGYPLVNKVFIASLRYTVLCGNPDAQCGEPIAQCGNFDGFLFTRKDYAIPSDASSFPYFLYIGGATFPNIQQVPAARKEEFEDLCLKLAPTQQWLGILIEYV